jgi:signal transduction histidine kinase
MSRRFLKRSILDFLLEAEANYPESPEAVHNSPLLNMIMSLDRDNLTRSFIERNCEAGEIIFKEHEPGNTMYLVWSGRVAIFKGDPSTPTILAFRSAGAIVGEMSVLDNQPRSATVVALDDVRLMGMNRHRFERLLQDYPLMSLTIMEMFSSRLRESDKARNTGELSEKKLKQEVSLLKDEKERLEKLDHLRQETTDLVIHDLRNPLNSIGVSLKMLDVFLPEDVMEKNKEILRIAQASCQHMQHLVDSLLDISRMDAGEIEFSIGELDLRPMMEESIRKFSIINTKNIRLETNIPEDLPLVSADREKIERILINLLDNAYKYTPDEGYIRLSAEQKKDMVQVCVIDNGTGIPKNERRRVFERFAQVPAERGKRRGFGLGLAYCKLAIERHLGEIWAEAGEDEIGSRFCFTLPIATFP